MKFELDENYFEWKSERREDNFYQNLCGGYLCEGETVDRKESCAAERNIRWRSWVQETVRRSLIYVRKTIFRDRAVGESRF